MSRARGGARLPAAAEQQAVHAGMWALAEPSEAGSSGDRLPAGAAAGRRTAGGAARAARARS
jgi:hypothetical protein